jgi:hypothetical protein
MRNPSAQKMLRHSFANWDVLRAFVDSHENYTASWIENFVLKISKSLVDVDKSLSVSPMYQHSTIPSLLGEFGYEKAPFCLVVCCISLDRSRSSAARSR